jgi:hypothetical protein
MVTAATEVIVAIEVIVVMMDIRVNKEFLVEMATMAIQDHRARKESAVSKDQLVLEVIRAKMASRAQKVKMEKMAKTVKMVKMVSQESKALKAKMVTMAYLIH